MSDVCPKCGDASVSTESDGACLNCGFVVANAPDLVQDKVPFVTDGNYFRAYGIDITPKTHLNRHHFLHIAKGRAFGKKLITRVGLRLGCDSHMTEEAKALYDRVFDHDSFCSRRMTTKAVLAAACFYIVCRQFRRVVTMHDIADLAQCSVFDLDRWKKEILETFGLEIKSVDLLELAKARCERANFDRAVISLTEKVIRLCQKLWISEGRTPEIIIAATSFVAWQGDDPSTRLKTSFYTFCRRFKFTYSRQAAVVLALIQDVLCELAKQIPWVEENSVDPSRVALHLKDIVNFQNTLIAAATADDEELDSSVSDDGVCSGDESGANSVSLSDTKPHLPSTSAAQCDSSAGHSEQPNKSTESRKRLSKHCLFLSKRSRVAEHTETNCGVEEQKYSTTMNLDSEELGSEDIPDSDLHMFIKTEAEVDDVRKLF